MRNFALLALLLAAACSSSSSSPAEVTDAGESDSATTGGHDATATDAHDDSTTSDAGADSSGGAIDDATTRDAGFGSECDPVNGASDCIPGLYSKPGLAGVPAQCFNQHSENGLADLYGHCTFGCETAEKSAVCSYYGGVCAQWSGTGNYYCFPSP